LLFGTVLSLDLFPSKANVLGLSMLVGLDFLVLFLIFP